VGKHRLRKGTGVTCSATAKAAALGVVRVVGVSINAVADSPSQVQSLSRPSGASVTAPRAADEVTPVAFQAAPERTEPTNTPRLIACHMYTHCDSKGAAAPRTRMSFPRRGHCLQRQHQPLRRRPQRHRKAVSR
jgi:hypothetical protein